MTKVEAIEEINKVFEPAFANYIITALTEGATASDKTLDQEPILDKVRAEIEQIEINGHIRDVECFRAGINTALNIIDKCRKEQNDE